MVQENVGEAGVARIRSHVRKSSSGTRFLLTDALSALRIQLNFEATSKVSWSSSLEHAEAPKRPAVPL